MARHRQPPDPSPAPATPGTYQQWAEVLDRWSAAGPEDADVADAVAALPPVVPEHFRVETLAKLVDRIAEAVSDRLDAWADALGRALDHADDEFGVGLALVRARPGLHAIRDMARHPGLPADVREHLGDQVDAQIRNVQEMLDAEPGRMQRRGAPAQRVEARRRTLAENRLLAVLAEPPDSAPAAPPVPGLPPGTKPRRRILPPVPNP